MTATPETARWPLLFRGRVGSSAKYDYPLHVRVLENGAPGPLDMDIHQGLEVNLVLEGRFERYFEDMVMVANPGDVSLVAPWEPHAWRIISPGTTAVAIIFLAEVIGDDDMGDVPWLSVFTAPPSERPRTDTPEKRAAFMAIGSEMLTEAKAQRPGWLVAVRLSLLRLLFAMARDWRPAPTRQVQRPARVAHFQHIRPAVDLVHGDPLRRITQEDAAAVCKLRPSQFGRLFRNTVGMTFSKFQMRARIAVVAHRLLSTDMSIEDVAADTGFVDGSHLHHAFMKYYGCTPGRFRELRR
ncbi:MAG: helix-turn-helix domain-containing protein [Armatimonadota bacterium]